MYDDAARYFFEATDREPSAIEPYLVLGRARNSPVGQMQGFSERMARFARLHPENAWANYYLGTEDSLQRAVRIDPGFEEAWFELGVVYENQDNRAGAVEAWKKAPARPEAHYRLSRAYRQSGDPAQAQAELELYEKLSRQAAGGPAGSAHNVYAGSDQKPSRRLSESPNRSSFTPMRSIIDRYMLQARRSSFGFFE